MTILNQEIIKLKLTQTPHQHNVHSLCHSHSHNHKHRTNVQQLNSPHKVVLQLQEASTNYL